MTEEDRYKRGGDRRAQRQDDGRWQETIDRREGDKRGCRQEGR